MHQQYLTFNTVLRGSFTVDLNEAKSWLNVFSTILICSGQ